MLSMGPTTPTKAQDKTKGKDKDKELDGSGTAPEDS